MVLVSNTNSRRPAGGLDTEDTDFGTVSEPVAVTGIKANMTAEERARMDAEEGFDTTSVASSAIAFSALSVRRQPSRAAKTSTLSEQNVEEEVQSESSTISELASITMESSILDTDMSDTSSISITAPAGEFPLEVFNLTCNVSAILNYVDMLCLKTVVLNSV